ncbi:multicopper oxidase domain-containing protein [Cupriavidus sp. WKF15]|uniref:multicopper oxidase domain-containing protein n=1 Tax=Cupriavidus sp. WKF15 TaxID=3032282 RepID=UPI0023E172AB|nr:multicopper oxidase domain-containing protein [Cupriavidus sp. WKF15]WER50077.1 multicopper oxidase domain-containing protein [Cupriavidus sp. WKF15]
MPTRCIAFVLAALAAGTVMAAIVSHDNTHPAGRLEANVLHLHMVADIGTWRPQGVRGVSLQVAAFAEEGKDLLVPGPLIRVPEGTTVELTLRNALSWELSMFGLCARPGTCEPIAIPPGESRNIRFVLNGAGTYHYWGSTGPSTLAERTRRDSQLGGAIIVERRGEATPDGIFVISSYDAPRPEVDDPRKVAVPDRDVRIFAINGWSWPHTPRLRYHAGDAVRWRIVNLSNIGHAMHLHGFHFKLDSVGDGSVDRALAEEQRRTEVTEFVGPGRTFALSWTPTRPGNWLFHCHMVEHMTQPGFDAHATHGDDHAAGMAGLVLGIEIDGSASDASAAAPRRLSLVLHEEPHRYGERSGYRIDLAGADAPRLDSGPVPGPVLVLYRGEPVEIEIVNRLSESTAMHWHGIEIESYYDGVPGFGGQGARLAPPITPGGSFVARFTPPRAGTFIYHTHWHDEAQLAGGLYGALLVLEPGERYDPSTDHIIVIGLNGVLTQGEREPFALNGRATPAPIRLRAGVPNRLRLINITANNSVLTAFLIDRSDLATWKPVAKDGARLPPEQRDLRPARQLISVGETYDFEITPPRPQDLWLEIRRGNGEWVLQAPVVVR